MDYSKAKKLHPNLKVRNAKALIAEIRRAEPSPGAFTLPPIKVNGKPALESMLKMDGRLGNTEERYPVYFDMSKWIRAVESNHFWIRADEDSVCGTAACIAGFAHLLGIREMAKKGARPKHATMAGFRSWMCRQSGESTWTRMVNTLAEFLGVDHETADRMSSVSRLHGDRNADVEPRHAALLLEIFLKTGHVEWGKAMGRNPDGTLTVAERAKRSELHDFVKNRMWEARRLEAA